MADAMVEPRPGNRFFCHRCKIRFEGVLQDYTCPFCASGFIEQLESDAEGVSLSGEDFSDADMSNIDDSHVDDSDEVLQNVSAPMLDDLAFLMSGGRLRGAGRPETLLEQLVFTIAGGAGPVGGGAVTAGAPFVLVGAPGDYVFGGEGLDSVVTQLLGQLENAGPPPLPRDQIAAIPSEAVSPEQAAANTSCSVCWENFQQGETISRLECDHIFHSMCIGPWLQLHATCPICRRSLLAEPPAAESDRPVAEVLPFLESDRTAPEVLPFLESATATATTTAAARSSNTSNLSLPRVLLRRLPRRRVSGPQTQTWDSPADTSSSSSTSGASSVTAGGVWVPHTRSATSTGSNSSSSLNSTNDRDLHYNMDIDFD